MYVGDAQPTYRESLPFHDASFPTGLLQDDMSRTEDLTTKLRTLSYDHERLTSMFKSEADKAANAEREMNLHKTRMT